MEEKVSIIVPVYHAEKFIRQTIDCVLAQTYENWELLLVDDCGKDGSVDVIEAFLA
jgi:teichuronic acid biosynthesis glycosyltransferase TuaG